VQFEGHETGVLPVHAPLNGAEAPGRLSIPEIALSGCVASVRGAQADLTWQIVTIAGRRLQSLVAERIITAGDPASTGRDYLACVFFRSSPIRAFTSRFTSADGSGSAN
jgi:hypothetical protein